MALTKAKIVDAVQTRLQLPRKKSMEAVEAIVKIIKNSLEGGDDVLISGFGKFQVKEKKERRGRNPATGRELMLAPRRVVTFRCSGKLKERVNGA